jgi:hypothetical protein
VGNLCPRKFFLKKPKEKDLQRLWGERMGRLTQYSAPNLSAEAQVDSDRWNQQPSASIVAHAVENIQRRGLAVIRAHNGEIALETLKDLIPPRAEVMSGASTTLLEIGYDEYVNSDRSRWNDLHRAIVAEK